MTSLISLSIAIVVLILALILDLIIGDPSPNYPSRIQFKLHPTVWMGKFTKALEPYFKNPNPKLEKVNGIILGLIVIITFTLPTFFGLEIIYSYLGILVYVVAAAIILKFTICMKLETNWGKAAAKAIREKNMNEARKYAHFSRRDNKDLTASQIVSSVIESMSENLTDFRLSPIFYYAFFGSGLSSRRSDYGSSQWQAGWHI